MHATSVGIERSLTSIAVGILVGAVHMALYALKPLYRAILLIAAEVGALAYAADCRHLCVFNLAILEHQGVQRHLHAAGVEEAHQSVPGLAGLIIIRSYQTTKGTLFRSVNLSMTPRLSMAII